MMNNLTIYNYIQQNGMTLTNIMKKPNTNKYIS